MNKLNFLMELTHSKNISFSKAVSFDPSYISRIRNGTRQLPRSPQFVEQAASFFAKRIVSPEQMEQLGEVLYPDSKIPDDKDALHPLIADWLYQGSESEPDSITKFLDNLSRTGKLGCAMAASPSGPSRHTPEEAAAFHTRLEQLKRIGGECGYFYGVEGKRQAIELFLGNLCASGEAYQLLLYSDEEMSWLYEDPAFAKRWAGLLWQLLSTGSRIRIPHNITRDSNEMFEAVHKWIPLYITGAIEPYYYPRLRDGVYHRSLFIARGHSALISDSIGSGTEGMLNLLITDPDAVRALEKEYENYIRLCKPLMTIYTNTSAKACVKEHMQFLKAPGELITAHSLPSPFTLPLSITRSFKASGNRELQDYCNKSGASFREHMKNGDRLTEILHLPDVQDVLSGSICLPFCDLFGDENRKMSPEIMHAEVKNMIRLLKKEPTYQIVLSRQIPRNISLQVRQGSGAILSHAEPPSASFVTREFHMMEAFREYLLRIRDESLYNTKENVIAQLEVYLGKM